MPPSRISFQRSFPSRVRSPTPAKTETPPDEYAKLWINSMMTTVLPTPAPPNKPILPPRRYGSIRSITLMPVSNICKPVCCSSNAGAVRWIGIFFAVFTGPMLSTGSPKTFSTRPNVCGPTGTITGAPVEIACIPRTRPSVGCNAIVRTRFSPICCATSTTMLIGSGTTNPSETIRIAVRIGGICPSGN